MIRRLRRGAAVCCRGAAVGCLVVAGLVVVAPTTSGAEGPQAVGWWSRQLPLQDNSIEGQSVGAPVRFDAAATPRQVPDTTLPGTGPVTTIPLPANPPTLPESPVTLPDPGTGTPNPSVPDGGLWVANDVTGPSAVSALRFRGDIGEGLLTLQFAPGSTVVGPIVACPIISDWAPGPAGAWRDRPAHDCDRFELSGRLTPDGLAVQFTIPQGFMTFGERVLDIIVMPARTSGDVFNLYFEAPDADSFEVYGGQELPPPETTLPPVDEAALPTIAPPTTRLTVPTTLAVTTSTTDDTEVAAPPVVSSPVPQPVSQVFEPLTESRAARIFAVLLLFGLATGLWWLGGLEVRAPQLIGGLAGAPGARAAASHIVEHDGGRGIGRFRRQRSGPPTRF